MQELTEFSVSGSAFRCTYWFISRAHGRAFWLVNF